jgi:hypothetical protein
LKFQRDAIAGTLGSVLLHTGTKTSHLDFQGYFKRLDSPFWISTNEIPPNLKGIGTENSDSVARQNKNCGNIVDLSFWHIYCCFLCDPNVRPSLNLIPNPLGRTGDKDNPKEVV